MGNLKFEDINEWTPASISIVDEPSHPCCHFEVYHDDEEYVKKSIEINEGETMTEENSQMNEPMVQAPVSFFERLLGRTVGKAVDEVPPQEPEKKESDLEARIAALEEKVAKLENAEEKPEEKNEAAPGAVAKSEGEGETSEAEAETTTEETQEENQEEETSEEDKVLDEKEVVAKSKSIDPDTVASSSVPEKSLVERTGRNVNGMTW